MLVAVQDKAMNYQKVCSPDNIIIIIIEIYKPNQIPEMLLSALQEEY